MIENRYIKNLGETFTEQDQNKLLNTIVAVIGAGGNGGYIIEFLIRLGIKKLIIYDGDNFSETNLNRQIYCCKESINNNKACYAKQKCEEINPTVEVIAYPRYCAENYREDLEILSNVDIIFQAADTFINNYQLRLLYKELITDYNIPIVETYAFDLGTRTTIYTKKDMSLFNANFQNFNTNPKIELPSQTAYLCALAGIEAVTAGIKYICNKKYCPVDEQLTCDIIHNKYIREDKWGNIY